MEPLRDLTFKEVLEGVERAHNRVCRWPDWKRELSREVAVPSKTGLVGTEGVLTAPGR